MMVLLLILPALSLFPPQRDLGQLTNTACSHWNGSFNLGIYRTCVHASSCQYSLIINASLSRWATKQTGCVCVWGGGGGGGGGEGGADKVHYFTHDQIFYPDAVALGPRNGLITSHDLNPTPPPTRRCYCIRIV